jgi:hypothetical protein
MKADHILEEIWCTSKYNYFTFINAVTVVTATATATTTTIITFTDINTSNVVPPLPLLPPQSK